MKIVWKFFCGIKSGICASRLIYLGILMAMPLQAQIPPSESEIAAYEGLLAAAAAGDGNRVSKIIQAGTHIEQRDSHGRTPLHVAAFAGHHDVMRKLAAAGADLDALENDRYDIVTIAAVAGDGPTLALSLELGASPANITSIYDGTALIAAAHLGHVKVVEILIEAGAPLDHVNNLGWTAVIEAIVLGDGGRAHTRTLKALVDAGADINLRDRQGNTPLALATVRGYLEMMKLLRR
jgi:ankyrin repeat protein